ncbi:MAG: peptidylprolyl isomerase [Rhodocyclaceae bacterium]|nr:peptidylprolyl isomerase [Rhodocyclaceae bacterium]
MRKPFLAALAALLPLLFSPASPAQARRATPVEVDRIVAVVNDEAITLFELRARKQMVERQLRSQGTPLPPDDQLTRQLLERMIVDRAQLQFARETGLRIGDQELDATLRRIAEANRLSLAEFRQAIESDGIPWAKFREEIRDEMTVARLREREVDAQVSVTDGEIDNYLANPQSVAGPPEAVHIAHIILRVPEQASPDQLARVQAKAEQVLAQVRAGENFAKVAAAFSDAPDALTGGSMGLRSADHLPTLYADAAAKLSVGQVSGVLRSPAGLHIIKVVERKGGALQAQALRQTRARHILVKVNELVSESEARRKLVLLKERLDNGADFAELARLHSNDLSAAKGGDLGWVYQGDTVPEFERVMDALPIGKFSEPTQSPFGWHLIQVLERKTEDASEERRRLIARAALRGRKADEAYQDWLRQMRDRAYVEYRLEDR